MIRPYQPDDYLAIAEIFPRAVHEIACAVYTPEQCHAWSETKPNPDHWRQRCEQKQPFIYERDGEVVGFLELEPDGHIDCCYVHPKAARSGVGTALIQHAVATAFARGLDRLHVEASICAKPVFEKQGFRVLYENNVNIRGVDLINYKMELKKV
ncbi:GNAT family N-acetyltransferase [Cerasicoccus fimbriatus]|uniref:GNAT family N-acetyltransferase n=1 Tax=Cerasicoccus fimbriatus TaxID=3014554 RepID=UPI0022B54A77|nr:GNAT family N-acetyltransferase [Cerasicoccus sp. TK19100]